MLLLILSFFIIYKNKIISINKKNVRKKVFLNSFNFKIF